MILISPWSRKTTDGKTSPKNYPHWPNLVVELRNLKMKLVQVSQEGEMDIGADERLNDLPLDRIYQLLTTARTWVSVDNFWHHMAWTRKVPGVAIFGPSDPEIFGHPENVNVLVDRRQLRKRQFGLWSQEACRPEIFPSPAVVMSAVRSLLR